jgi:hypothetical protein
VRKQVKQDANAPETAKQRRRTHHGETDSLYQPLYNLS